MEKESVCFLTCPSPEMPQPHSQANGNCEEEIWFAFPFITRPFASQLLLIVMSRKISKDLEKPGALCMHASFHQHYFSISISLEQISMVFLSKGNLLAQKKYSRQCIPTLLCMNTRYVLNFPLGLIYRTVIKPVSLLLFSNTRHKNVFLSGLLSHLLI